MAFCNKCGMEYKEGTKFCTGCGMQFIDAQPKDEQALDKDSQRKDAAQNQIYAFFAYLGVLVIIPLLAAKESRFARFHAGQGLVLLVLQIGVMIIRKIAVSIVAIISWRLVFLVKSFFGLIRLGLFIFMALGIFNVVQCEEKKLPVIGEFAFYK